MYRHAEILLDGPYVLIHVFFEFASWSEEHVYYDYL